MPCPAKLRRRRDKGSSMSLTRLSIQRPLAILMALLGLVIMGGVAYTMLRVVRLPDISARAVSVRVSYAGASPTDIESLVIEPIEQALSVINGVASISS